MLDKVKYYLKALRDSYLIQIDYVELGKNPGDVPVSKFKQYIILNKDESIDYTTDIKSATLFSLALGSLIINKLKSNAKETPNLQFSLISIGDANFVDTITSGSTVKKPSIS